MPWPPLVQDAAERMKRAEDALRADTDSGEPYNSERRNRLLTELQRAMAEFYDKVSQLRS